MLKLSQAHILRLRPLFMSDCKVSLCSSSSLTHMTLRTPPCLWVSVAPGPTRKASATILVQQPNQQEASISARVIKRLTSKCAQLICTLINRDSISGHIFNISCYACHVGHELCRVLNEPNNRSNCAHVFRRSCVSDSGDFRLTWTNAIV